MAIDRLSIDAFLPASTAALVIDVRSPGEYHHGHIPGAVSMPLFSNEERAVVGTAYKQQSREAAIKEGLNFFGPKMREMVEQVEEITGKRAVSHTSTINYAKEPLANIPVFLYCWRGGMRSGAVAWLLNLYGFQVKVLQGGYKAYRRHVLAIMEQPFSFHVLGGYTGSGKTEVLQTLAAQDVPVIDLEKIASHKGSAFGKMGMPPQPTQEMFENLLALHLKEAVQKSQSLADPLLYTPIWVEDESQRIGQLNIPGALWNRMRQSPLYFMDIPFEERLAHIIEEYGAYNPEELAESIIRITRRLGGLETKNALQHLADNNIAGCFRILLRYYDKQYKKGLYTRPQLQAQLLSITADTVTPQNANLLLPSLTII